MSLNSGVLPWQWGRPVQLYHIPKILYGPLLDYAALFIRNNWPDEEKGIGFVERK